MFQAIARMPAMQTLEVVHQSISVLREMARVSPTQREQVVRELHRVLKEGDPTLPLEVVREIERREGAPLNTLRQEVIDRYAGELAETAEQRVAEEIRPDPERGRELLRRMRATSPYY